MQNIEILAEDIVLLAERSRIPGRPNRWQLRRWCTYGVRSPVATERITLEWAWLGCQRATSKQALQRFLAKCNGAVEPDDATEAGQKEHQLEHQRAAPRQDLR